MIKSLILSAALFTASFANGQSRWTEARANQWYEKQPWLVGANFIPSNAINELEMWQSDTWDPATIDRELGWAEKIGMNTMRVFLHDLLWQDPEGFKKRLDQFLQLCEKHHIKPMLVLFDSVWDPNPKSGKQREPKPGLHNSGWVQSPGADALKPSASYPRLEAYVKGVIGAFAHDKRILAWDLWNEPDNVNTNNYPEPPQKVEWVQQLMPKVFAWARQAGPDQPLTTGVWKMDLDKEPNAFEKMQIELSDVISFHSYSAPAIFQKYIDRLQVYHRPLLCTEYLARGNGSKFENILPLGKKYKVAMINWGLVKGKTQTNLPWDSWEKPYINGREPAVWHHEVFYPDGKPYQQAEVDAIRSLTGKK